MKNMRKIRFAAVLPALCGALLVLDSCRKQPEFNELGDKIVGAWFCEYDATGVIDFGGEPIPYTHVAQYAEYNKDGTGMWCVAYFGSNRNAPRYMLGGHAVTDTYFHFRATADGSVTMFRDSDTAGMPQYWTVFYADDRINISDGGYNAKQMERATESQKAKVVSWEQSLLGNDSGMIDLGGYDETEG